MDITQEQLDALQAQYDEATAELEGVKAQLQEAQTALETAQADSVSALKAMEDKTSASAELMQEIVALCFEHGASKDVTLNAMKADSVAAAGLIILKENKSDGAAQAGDLEGGESNEVQTYADKLAQHMKV